MELPQRDYVRECPGAVVSRAAVYCDHCGRKKATGDVLRHPGGCACDACEAVCWGNCEAFDWRAALEGIARAWWTSNATHAPQCYVMGREPRPCSCGFDEVAALFEGLPDSMQPGSLGL